jgi:hypothetical protein
MEVGHFASRYVTYTGGCKAKGLSFFGVVDDGGDDSLYLEIIHMVCS